jgi:parallel beta-helix repeat protein
MSPVNHYFGHGFLGNYFDDYPLVDHNNDGIADAFYVQPDNEIRTYPLSNTPENYECETQIIDHQNQLISDEMAEMQSKCLCAAGQTVLFQSSPERHGRFEWSRQNAWTGNICFAAPIQENHQLSLQLGKVDTQGIFTKAGQGFTIVGKGKKVNFPFCIFPGDFFIDTNEQFAFQIINNSPVDYNIWIGGGHTHISPYTHQNATHQTWNAGKDATFRSIGSALNLLADFQTGMPVTLNVLPGTYTENITIDRHVSLISTDGYTHTTIVAKRSDHHVIHIQSDNVHIEGFSILGANRKNASGLCIDRGVANCYIANNRLGMDETQSNDYGMIIHASIKNTLIRNYCIANEKHGIWMDTAFMNQLTLNTCFQNQGAGIYLTGSLLNHLTHNICENNGDDGIHLIKSSRNHMKYNFVAANEKNGLFLDEHSFINLIYLNDFSMNRKHNVLSQGVNQWMSDTKKRYQYCGHVLTSLMGNYYGDYVGPDHDQNGLIDAPYHDNGMDHADSHALLRPYSFYEFVQATPTVHLVSNQASDITQNIIAEKAPIRETAQSEIPTRHRNWTDRKFCQSRKNITSDKTRQINATHSAFY